MRTFNYSSRPQEHGNTKISTALDISGAELSLTLCTNQSSRVRRGRLPWTTSRNQTNVFKSPQQQAFARKPVRETK